MKIDDYKDIWTKNKEDFVLIKLNSDYGIYNQVDKIGVIIEDDQMEKKVIDMMINNGTRILDSISE